MDDALQLTDAVVHIPRDVVDYLIGDLQAVMLHEIVKDVASQVFLRLLHLSHQAALEAGDEALLHSL